MQTKLTTDRLYKAKCTSTLNKKEKVTLGWSLAMNGVRRFIIMTIISFVTVLALMKLRQSYESHSCFD